MPGRTQALEGYWDYDPLVNTQSWPMHNGEPHGAAFISFFFSFEKERVWCVDALFGRSANTRVLQREWLASHTLARPHGVSLTNLERNLNFLGKPEYPVSQTGWSGFGRFSLHRQPVPMMEIGPTSTQAVSGRAKVTTVANSRSSGSRDWWEEEEELNVGGLD
jgi:hypothetical protein